MAETDKTILLKEKLLSAGIDEIAAHGVRDFSLRRVAAACGASCAAPYKHFKNKEEFLQATIRYINEKWDHLSRQISSSFDDPIERVARLCAANVRFKLANPLYDMGGGAFTPSITEEIRALCRDDGADGRPSSAACPGGREAAESEAAAIFTISALVSGTAWLIESGKLANSEQTISLLMQKVRDELTKEVLARNELTKEVIR